MHMWFDAQFDQKILKVSIPQFCVPLDKTQVSQNMLELAQERRYSKKFLLTKTKKTKTFCQDFLKVIVGFEIKFSRNSYSIFYENRHQYCCNYGAILYKPPLGKCIHIRHPKSYTSILTKGQKISDFLSETTPKQTKQFINFCPNLSKSGLIKK